jgi:hypothetical protein
MRKIILFFFSFVCTILMYGQREVKMTGVDGIKPEVLNRIIADSQRQIRTRSIDDCECLWETKAINVFHRDIDTGEELPKTLKGRVIIYYMSDGIESSKRPRITHFPENIPPSTPITRIEEKDPPKGYDSYSVLLVTYFSENLDMIIEANKPIIHNDTDRKYMAIYLLNEKN